MRFFNLNYNYSQNVHYFLIHKILAISIIIIMSPISEAQIQISSIEELQLIGSNELYPLDGEYVLTQDIDASETVNWNEGAGFKPIGIDETEPFDGKFNGGGKTIKGLYINLPNHFYTALFGFAGPNAKIENLKLINCHVRGKYHTGGLAGSNSGFIHNCCIEDGTIISEADNTGGVVGRNYGSLSRCFFKGSISGNNTIGGITGYNSGSINECYSKADIVSNSIITTYNIGGLAGYTLGEILNSYSMGSVTGMDTVGGLIGFIDGAKVSFCFSSCQVTGTSNTGGLIGANTGEVQSSYWDIELSGQNTSAGGEGRTTEQMKSRENYVNWDFETIWGILEGKSYPFFRWQTVRLSNFVVASLSEAEAILNEHLLVIGNIIERCSDDIEVGDVAPLPMEEVTLFTVGSSVNLLLSTGPCPVIEIDSVEELQQIGINSEYPLDGNYLLMTDVDAYATSTWNNGKGFIPIGTQENPFIGKFDGQGHKIIGLNINRPDEDYIGLFGCMGYGAEVRRLGLEINNRRAHDHIGSFCGLNEGSIIQCYVIGGQVEGNTNVGGIVGWNKGLITQAYSVQGLRSFIGTGGGFVGKNEGTIKECYSADRIISEGTMGGLIGVNIGGSIERSYWNIDISGITYSDGGIGLTKEGMRTPSNYVDWDFETVWGIIENKTYPFFYWQKISVPDVAGLSFVEAEELLNLNFLGVADIRYECNDEIQSMYVSHIEEVSFLSIPEQPRILPVGSEVVVVISTGPCYEGEGFSEGSFEGEFLLPHSADPNGDWRINLSELLRVIQFFNLNGYHCALPGEVSEDGYIPGFEGDKSCTPHSSDYKQQNWIIELEELLRLIQIFNVGGYYSCPGIGEDGFCLDEGKIYLQ